MDSRLFLKHDERKEDVHSLSIFIAFVRQRCSLVLHHELSHIEKRELFENLYINKKCFSKCNNNSFFWVLNWENQVHLGFSELVRIIGRFWKVTNAIKDDSWPDWVCNVENPCHLEKIGCQIPWGIFEKHRTYKSKLHLSYHKQWFWIRL